MNKKFRWGIMGKASIARTLMGAMVASGNGEVAGIASRSKERAGEWARRHGIARAFGSYEELLDCRDLDGVYIPLPNSMHAQWTIRALEAGLPVLCEKPLATNAGEARRIGEAAARTGQYVAEAFMYRFHPAFAAAREIMARGEIGALSTIFSRFTFHLDDRSEIPASAELAGGALMDVGCYCVNVSRLVAGREPVRVSALAVRSDVDDTMVGLMEFPGGVLAQFETSIENFERHGVEIGGTRGSITLANPWVPGNKDVEIVVRTAGSPDQKIVVPGADAYRLEVEEFVEVCRQEKAPTWTIDDSVRNLEVMDALASSCRDGKPVAISPTP